MRDVGYEHPSPIQAATIPALLEVRHVIGLAQTSTGRTAGLARDDDDLSQCVDEPFVGSRREG